MTLRSSSTSSSDPDPTHFLVGVRALRGSLRGRATSLRRRAMAERQHGNARLVGLTFMAVVVVALVFSIAFGGGRWIASRNAMDLASAVVSFVLLFFMVALVLSSLGHAVTAFFTAKDLWFWESAPAPAWARFLDRLSETAVSALPSTLTMGALALSGFLFGANQSVWVVGRGFFALALVTCLPLCLGVVVAHVGGALLPAGRLRRVSLLLLGVGLTAFLVVLRRARVEDLVSTKGAERIVASARDLGAVGGAYWPHNVGARFTLDADVASVCVLLVEVSLAVAVAFGAHRFLFDRARDRAADDSPRGIKKGSALDRALSTLVAPLSSSLRPLVEKDALAFIRDPSQWSQLVLLLGVGVLYLVNCAALVEGFAAMPFPKEIFLVGVHTGITTFIAAGLSVRFAFPQMGLEGPAVWLLEAAPTSPRTIVIAKVLATIPVVVVFPSSVGLIGGVVLDLPTPLLGLTTLCIACVSLSFAAYAVGRGAERAGFDAPSTSELNMGPGALTTMTTTIFISGVAALATTAGAASFVYLDDSVLTAGPFFIGAPLISAILARRAMRDGAAGFYRRRVDGSAGGEGIAP